jgi:hypothetical protein
MARINAWLRAHLSQWGESWGELPKEKGRWLEIGMCVMLMPTAVQFSHYAFGIAPKAPTTAAGAYGTVMFYAADAFWRASLNVMHAFWYTIFLAGLSLLAFSEKKVTLHVLSGLLCLCWWIQLAAIASIHTPDHMGGSKYMAFALLCGITLALRVAEMDKNHCYAALGKALDMGRTISGKAAQFWKNLPVLTQSIKP